MAAVAHVQPENVGAGHVDRLSIRLSAELEGPSVARIFVERFLFIDEDFQVAETSLRERDEESSGPGDDAAWVSEQLPPSDVTTLQSVSICTGNLCDRDCCA